MTYGELIDRVVTLGGEDTSSAGLTRAQIGALVNDRYLKMVAGARAKRATVSLGSTVAATTTYALPANIVYVYRLLIGGVPSDRVSADQMEAIGQGWAYQTGVGSSFAETWDASGVASVQIYPAPASTGSAITARAAIQATPMVSESADSPFFDADLHSHIADGAMADLMNLVDERPDAGQMWEAKAAQGIEALRRRVNAKAGSARQVLVSGYHFAPWLGP